MTTDEEQQQPYIFKGPRNKNITEKRPNKTEWIEMKGKKNQNISK